LPLDRLISHRLPLDEVEHAFELLRSGTALRAVLDLS
jgi:Zn-dependent alcohol dehydrogenase